MKTDYRELLDRTYLGAWDLPDDKDSVATITNVTTGAVTNEQHETSTKILLTFKEYEKQMVCNVGNAENISKVAGSKYIENWIGVRVALYVRHDVKAFGKLRDAIRIRDYAPKLPDKVKCADCGKEIVAHGSHTAKAIAEGTRGAYGRPLCWECSEKAKEQAAEKAKESDIL